tara:strand:- start:3157 stop:3501 length:345 start_codon:yes stop_codon:yes gene_type:complete
VSKVGEHFRERFEMGLEEEFEITKEDMEEQNMKKNKQPVKVNVFTNTGRDEKTEYRLNWLLTILEHLGEDKEFMKGFVERQIVNVTKMDDETWDKYIRNIQMLDNGNVLVIDDK